MGKIADRFINAGKALLGHLDPEKQSGTYLTDFEKEQYRQYVILKQYYHPSINGLYRSKLPTGKYLYEERTWTTQEGILVKTYPEFLWAPFLPVSQAVDIDVAAIMNEQSLDNLYITKDGEAEIKDETEFVRNVLKENNHETFLPRIYETAASQRDSYVRPINTSVPDYEGRKMEHGIKLLLYPPEHVFPVISPYDPLQAINLRVYYRQEVVEEIDPESDVKLFHGVQREFYSSIWNKGSRGWIDGELFEDYKFDYDIIPMIHFGHRQGNDYFGRSSCEDIIDDIDHINLNFSAMWLLIKRMINPMLLAKGTGIMNKQLPIPTSLGPIILPVGADGDITPLVVEIATTHMQAIDTFVDHVRSKMHNYKLERKEMSKASTRPETMEAMSEGFKTHANNMMKCYAGPFSDLCNSILQVSGKVKDRRQIVYDMGPAMSEGVMDEIGKLKEVIQTLTWTPAIIKSLMQKLGMDDVETQEMIDKMEEFEKFQRETPESKRLEMTKAMAEKIGKDREKIAEKPDGKVGDETAIKNIYQLRVAIEEGAATPVDIRKIVFGEDEATAQREVKKAMQYNLENAEALAEIKKIEQTILNTGKPMPKEKEIAEPKQEPASIKPKIEKTE